MLQLLLHPNRKFFDYINFGTSSILLLYFTVVLIGEAFYLRKFIVKIYKSISGILKR